MAAQAAGFRVLGDGGGEGGGIGEPRIIAYRLDPETLAFSELAGGGDALFGFPAAAWHRPGFWMERLHPEDRAAARAFCRSWSEHKFSHRLEYRLIGADGRVHRVHDIVEVRRAPAGGPEIRGVLIDLTGRAPRQSDAEAALRLRDELLRIVAEEMAQPVRAIAGFGEMLGRHLSAQRDDVGSDYALGIREGVERLDTLVSRLLRVTQGGETSVEAIAESLAAIRDQGRYPDPAHDQDEGRNRGRGEG